MERKMKRSLGDKMPFRPDGIDARLAHARRHLAKQRRAKAEQAFLRSLREIL